MFPNMTEDQLTEWMTQTSNEDELFEEFCEDAVDDWHWWLRELLVGDFPETQKVGRTNLALGVMDLNYEGWGEEQFEHDLIEFLRQLQQDTWGANDSDPLLDLRFTYLLDGGFKSADRGYVGWVEEIIDLILTLGSKTQVDE